MTPKPDARILPTQEEFDSWTLHPVSRFVAQSYANQAKKCRDQWTALFNSRLVPVDLDAQRRLLSSQEECFRAFLESEYLDHLRSVDPESWRLAVDAAIDPKTGQRRKTK